MYLLNLKNKNTREFPGGLVVRSLDFHYYGLEMLNQSLVWKLRSHNRTVQSIKKEKRKFPKTARKGEYC